MPSTPTLSRRFPSAMRDINQAELTPLLPRSSSAVEPSAEHSRSRRYAATESTDHTDTASLAAASSLSVNNSLFSGGSYMASSFSDTGGGRSTNGDDDSAGHAVDAHHSSDGGENGAGCGAGNGRDGGGPLENESIFGTAPTSLSAFFAVFTHSVALQSWTSYLLALGFHFFHLALIVSFLLSPILIRSTVFSSQTMAKEILETRGIIQSRHYGNVSGLASGATAMESEQGAVGGRKSGAKIPSSVGHAPVAVESIWAIHDATFFLEPGHVVMPTNIENSFGSMHHGKHGGKRDFKDKKMTKKLAREEEKEAQEAAAAVLGRHQHEDGDSQTSKGLKRRTSTGTTGSTEGKGRGRGDDTHTYIVPRGGSTATTARPDTSKVNRALLENVEEQAGHRLPIEDPLPLTIPANEKDRRQEERDTVDTSTEKSVSTSDGITAVRAGLALVPMNNFAPPPLIAPQSSTPQRKSATEGQVTLRKIWLGWEASPLYSSPLALSLFYYLYNIGCLILLLTVTDGKLTGHFSVLRLGIALAELLWYVHHGAHAFVIYLWLLLLSHWPAAAMKTSDDAAFLHLGTPYTLVSRITGEVRMYLFYRAPSPDGGIDDGAMVHAKLDMQYYLYNEARYLKPAAAVIAVLYLVLLSFCIARDLHRMLDAVVGVRVLMEPEGCVRCPLCGVIMEVGCPEGPSRGGGKSIYQSARARTGLSMRRTRWWWRWIRSAIRGSSSGHRVPTPRLSSPLWRWLLPWWCCGGPQRLAMEVSVEGETEDHECGMEPCFGDDGPFTVAEMLEDIEFYEQSAVRRSAAAPQDTMAEETAHLMRWLTVLPRSEGGIVVPTRGQRQGSVSSSAADTMSSSATTSSSEEGVKGGLVKAVPTGAAGGVRSGAPAPAQPVTGPISANNKATAVVALPAVLAEDAASEGTSTPRPSQSRHSSSWHPPSPQRRGRHGLRRQHTGSSQRLHSQASSAGAAGPMGTTAGTKASARRRQQATRLAEEALYWNYATRHVHHRCPKLYLDTQQATDDDEDEEDSDEEGSDSESGSTSEAASTVSSSPPSSSALAAARSRQDRSVLGTLTASASAAAAGKPAVSQRGKRRSLSPRGAAARADPNKGSSGRTAGSSSTNTGSPHTPKALAERHPLLPPRPDGILNNTVNQAATNVARGYGTMGPSFSESPAQLFSRAPPPASANHIVQRGVYDPTKDEEDEFRPGNAFESFDRAGWLSRLTFSWLNTLLAFGLLEPTLLRQERFLPALPARLLSLDNIAIPAWRLWVHRKIWFPRAVAKPGELLIPSNEAMCREEERVMSLADLHDPELDDDGDDTESSEGQQTVVMLGHTSLKRAAKFRPQRPKRTVEERVFWTVTAPVRYLLVHAFYHLYLGTSRTVRRTRRRLVRELLKDRLVAAAEDLYDENGYQAMEANAAVEEATWALAEIASSCGSSAAAPSAGSALPTHMRRQLALSDVSVYTLFLEHRCGRRFLLNAAPLLLLSEALTLSLVPALVAFVEYLQKVETIDLLPGRRETAGDQENISTALELAVLLGVLMLLQGVVHGAYVSQVQLSALEARTCVRAMVLEKTLALPLAQRTFSEEEVVTLATEEAVRVGNCIVSLHDTWAAPLRMGVLALLLGHYLGWAGAAVAAVGPLLLVPCLRKVTHDARQCRHSAREAAEPRLGLLRQTLSHIREVKGMLLEGRLMRRFRKVRAAESLNAEKVAMAESSAGMLGAVMTLLLMVAALGAECAYESKALRDLQVLIPTMAVFVLFTAPLLELPALFALVARGFLSMKRLEAYLRQTPDEFVGTWVDLTSFSAMQQQLRRENPTSALLRYRRGSVVCRDSSFTWQHDLTEETPEVLLRGVDLCVEPGQLVVVQGSNGAGKTTLLLSILGEVNRCVAANAEGEDDDDRSSRSVTTSDYESDLALSVVSATEAAAAVAQARRADGDGIGAAATVVDNGSLWSHAGTNLISNSTTHTRVFPSPPMGRTVANMFMASPTDSVDRKRRRADCEGKKKDAAATNTAQSLSSPKVLLTGRPAAPRPGADVRPALDTSNSSPNAESVMPRMGLEEGETSTGGFLVFGSCAYCAAVPWLQNDTIRANIMASGGPVEMERWYNTVLRACALTAELAALPQGDATVIGDRGETLSLSMRCRIAIARAVYAKSHVYLFDSVLSPLEPHVRDHVIREVFHKLLRRRTVILASNVGLRLLRPHRVLSLVEGGVVREDTNLYRVVSSLHARRDDEGGNERGGGGESAMRSGVRADNNGSTRSHSNSSSSNGSQGTAAPLPPLFAEEFEEPEESASDRAITEDYENDPAAAAASLLFDEDDDFDLHDHLESGAPSPVMGMNGGGGAMAATGGLGTAAYYASLGTSVPGSGSGALRPRRTFTGTAAGALGASCRTSTPTRQDSFFSKSGLGASITSTVGPGSLALPPPAVPVAETAEAHRTAGMATVSSAPVTMQNLRQDAAAVPSAGELHQGDGVRYAASEVSSCSTQQYLRNHYAQQRGREKVLRHRHRLSFFIFLRFMGGQAIWLVLVTMLQQAAMAGIDIWAAVWLALMADTTELEQQAIKLKSMATLKQPLQLSPYDRVKAQLYIWSTMTDVLFLASICLAAVVVMVLTLVRSRAVHVGVYGTMYFIHNQIIQRILHAPASYFDSRIIALLTRVLEGDADVAEYRVPGTAEVLLSCVTQLLLVAVWNAFVNPVFLLLLPVMVSLFYHISKRHAVVVREVRRLELGSISSMADILREVYQGASTVRCMALQERLREEYCRALDTVNTAAMVAYLADRWVELRLHVLTSLAVCTAAVLGVVFTMTYSKPSLTAVAIIATMRAGPVLSTLCRSLGLFTVFEWVSVQRLMSLWSVPQEVLTLEGEADLYSYSHVPRHSTGFYVELEGGQDAPLVDLIGGPIHSPGTLAAVDLQRQERRRRRGTRAGTQEVKKPRVSQRVLGEEGSAAGHTLLSTPQSPFEDFSKPSSPSASSSSFSFDTQAAPGMAEEISTITLPHLELRNVSARYRTTLPYVLRHVNLAVFPRERLGVVGHAGQGKGSLFNVLLRLVDVIEGGGVFVDGEDAARVPYPILRGWFGLIPQEPLLVQGSWRTNLMIGYHPEHRMLIDGAQNGEDRPYLPIETLTRRQREAMQGKDGGNANTSAMAAIAAHLRPNPVATSPAIPCATGGVTRPGSGYNAPYGDGSVGSLAMSESRGSWESGPARSPQDGATRLRSMESVEKETLNRDASWSPSSGGKNRGSIFGRVANRLRDRFTPFRRHSSRSSSRRDPLGTPTRDSSEAGNSTTGARRRRRRSTRQPSLPPKMPSGASRGHVAEGPLQPVEDAALWAALHAVGLSTAVEFDGGLDAPLAGGDLTTVDLTDAQCRLLCLARAVLNKPPIVLLEDAVLSGSETQTDRVIQRVLANELRDSTVIIIAHRLSTVLNVCTRVVAMRDGVLLPIADLHSTMASCAPTPAPPVNAAACMGSKRNTQSDLGTPALAANLDPEVLRKLSYYVE